MKRDKRLFEDVYISKLGFGAAAIGSFGAYTHLPKKDALDALAYYFSQGGNFIDTAQGYNESEIVIGEFLKNSSDAKEAVISTKTRAGNVRETFAQIEIDLDESLRRMGRDYIDLYFFHNPPEEDDIMEEALDIMQNMKKKGKIRAIGSSIKGPDVTDATGILCKRYIDTKKIDAIQLIYSVVRQQNDEIFDYAMKNNIALIGRTSLESGVLSGKYRKGFVFPENDHRNRWQSHYDEIVEYIEQIEKGYIGKYDDSLASFSVRFAMMPEAITSTIVGLKNEEQTRQMVAAYDKGQLSEDVVKSLQQMFLGKSHLFNI